MRKLWKTVALTCCVVAALEVSHLVLKPEPERELSNEQRLLCEQLVGRQLREQRVGGIYDVLYDMENHVPAASYRDCKLFMLTTPHQ